VADVTAFLEVAADKLAKTVVMLADGEAIAVMVRGDHEVNPLKVRRLLGAVEVDMAPEATVREVTGAPVGFAGPIGIKCRIVADNALRASVNLVAGGNEADVHVVNVNVGRDFDVDTWADVRLAEHGDPCPKCSAPLATFRGIEVGHIFVLGTKYSDAMGAVYLDEGGASHPIQMGCYGAGVTRILAAAIEQNFDDNGIIWPMPIAPYEVHMVMLGKATDELAETATRIHDELQSSGIDVLLDDRDERPAVKFKDADLIGVPLRLTLGARGLKEGKIEVKWRTEAEPTLVALDEAVDHVRRLVDEARRT
jgi:prolyl-tRNA synthetase